MDNKIKIIEELVNSGVDINDFIVKGFEYYKKRRKENNVDNNINFVNMLIRIYYDLSFEKLPFNNVKESFINKYILNESKLEGVNDSSEHGIEEINGFGIMYRYMHTPEFDRDFNIFSIKDLNAKLFSLTPHPEYAGNFRNYSVFLPGTGMDLCDYSYIYPTLLELDKTVENLRQIAPSIRENLDVDSLFMYLDKCVELKCDLIKIHPFPDGNGRTIRCFINKLLEDVGLPSVYIKSYEKLEYSDAINKANNEGDYTDIKKFYRYKICDSIVELDIAERIKNRNNSEDTTEQVSTGNIQKHL